MPPDRERLHTLDILRGFALFGMILVHWHQRTRFEVTGWQDLIGWAVYILVEQKSWGTFAFLFGAGFAVLLRRLEARHAPVVAIYLRRLAALAIIGVIVEVGAGFHILFTYACWGLVLLVVRRWTSRALLATAIAAAMAPAVVASVMAIAASMSGAATAAPGPIAELRRAAEMAAGQDSYGTLLAARWALFSAMPSWRVLLPDVNFAMFVIGVLAVRHGIFDEPLKHVRTIRAWMIFGVLSWALAWTVLSNLPAPPIRGLGWPLSSVFGLVRDQWLSFFYIGAVVLLLAKRPHWTARLAPIGQAGRMALSNYVFQAAVIDALSSGYGLKLRLTPLAYVAGALALFGAEIWLSTIWLSRFRFGPLEWCWRAVTYWRRP